MLDPALQTRLLTDASDLAVSAILKQQDDAGVFHPVAFESCKPTQPERQYTPHLFELLAVVQALKTLRPYLLDTPFELHMDNASLQWLQQQCYVSHHQARWCARCCRLVRTNASGAGRSLVGRPVRRGRQGAARHGTYAALLTVAAFPALDGSHQGTCKLGTQHTIKISFPIEIHFFCTKCILFPLFHSFSRPPISFSRHPHSFSSLLRSQGLQELRESRAAESHWFRWKGTDVLFTIAVTLLPQRTQLIVDNYRGRQSRTSGPFQVPNTRTARGQHGPVARQSRVRFPVTNFDAGPMPAYF